MMLFTHAQLLCFTIVILLNGFILGIWAYDKLERRS